MSLTTSTPKRPMWVNYYINTIARYKPELPMAPSYEVTLNQVEYCENPFDLAILYEDYLQMGLEHTLYGIIEAKVSCIRRFDFVRSEGYSERGIPYSDDALPLDIQAMQLSEYAGFEITEQNICDYFRFYRNGYRKAILERIDRQFHKLTMWFSLEHEGIRHYLTSCHKKQVSAYDYSDCPF